MQYGVNKIIFYHILAMWGATDDLVDRLQMRKIDVIFYLPLRTPIPGKYLKRLVLVLW